MKKLKNIEKENKKLKQKSNPKQKRKRKKQINNKLTGKYCPHHRRKLLPHHIETRDVTLTSFPHSLIDAYPYPTALPSCIHRTKADHQALRAKLWYHQSRRLNHVELQIDRHFHFWYSSFYFVWLISSFLYDKIVVLLFLSDFEKERWIIFEIVREKEKGNERDERSLCWFTFFVFFLFVVLYELCFIFLYHMSWYIWLLVLKQGRIFYMILQSAYHKPSIVTLWYGSPSCDHRN